MNTSRRLRATVASTMLAAAAAAAVFAATPAAKHANRADSTWGLNSVAPVATANAQPDATAIAAVPFDSTW